jgi:hypothetical protein
MFRCFGDGKPFLAGGRIVNHDPVLLARLQDNEMIHVPVQDSRETQLAQMVNLDSQRPACQAQVSRYPHEVAESDTFQRDCVPPPQAIHVSSMAMIGRYHGQACQPAFRRLGLPDEREEPAPAEVQ